MTIIIGIERAGKVILAGDLEASADNVSFPQKHPKVFIRQGIVFGFSTSFRFGQLLQFCTKIPEPIPSTNILEWLVTVFIPELRVTISNAQYKDPFDCLIGIGGELYILQSDFSVIRSAYGYAAIGSAAEFALGCVSTHLSIGKFQPVENILEMSIASCSDHCSGVSESCVVVSN